MTDFRPGGVGGGIQVITTSGSGGNIWIGSGAGGNFGRFSVQVVPPVSSQQWPPASAHFQHTNLYSRDVAFASHQSTYMSPAAHYSQQQNNVYGNQFSQQHYFSPPFPQKPAPIGFSAGNQQQFQTNHWPNAAPVYNVSPAVHHRPAPQINSQQFWLQPAKPQNFKPAPVAQAPQTELPAKQADSKPAALALSSKTELPEFDEPAAQEYPPATYPKQKASSGAHPADEVSKGVSAEEKKAAEDEQPVAKNKKKKGFRSKLSGLFQRNSSKSENSVLGQQLKSSDPRKDNIYEESPVASKPADAAKPEAADKVEKKAEIPPKVPLPYAERKKQTSVPSPVSQEPFEVSKKELQGKAVTPKPVFGEPDKSHYDVPKRTVPSSISEERPHHDYETIDFGESVDTSEHIYEDLDDYQQKPTQSAGVKRKRFWRQKSQKAVSVNSKAFKKAVKKYAKPTENFLKANDQFSQQLESHTRLVQKAQIAFANKDHAQGYSLMKDAFNELGNLRDQLDHMKWWGMTAAVNYSDLLTAAKKGDTNPPWMEKLENGMQESQARCEAVEKYMASFKLVDDLSLQGQIAKAFKAEKAVSNAQEQIRRDFREG